MSAPTVDLRHSWLVQRLKMPATGRMGAISAAFAFGGGLRNGGLSPDAMGLLSSAFSFDYMGAAEFEFGAVPKALQSMSRMPLSAWSIEIPLSSVLPSWRDKTPAPEGVGTVYVLAPSAWRAEVDARITGWAAGDGRTKESVHLNTSLRPFDEWDRDVCGWLEVDNGFAFFTDRDMWHATCDIFGVEQVHL